MLSKLKLKGFLNAGDLKCKQQAGFEDFVGQNTFLLQYFAS